MGKRISKATRKHLIESMKILAVEDRVTEALVNCVWNANRGMTIQQARQHVETIRANQQRRLGSYMERRVGKHRQHHAGIAQPKVLTYAPASVGFD